MSSISLIAAPMSCLLTDKDRTFRLDVSGFQLDSGQALALIGHSGTGKTLFLEMLTLLRRPEVGSTYASLDGDVVADLLALWGDPVALQRRRATLFGFVPQTGALLRYLSAWDNAALAQELTGRIDLDWLGTLFDVLDLTQERDKRPEGLSIGQRQRVAIARALAHKPAFVIADEPTSALDPDNALVVLKLLLKLARETGTGVLLSSHDQRLLDRLSINTVQLLKAADSTEKHVRVMLNTAQVAA
jgi:putative ABC transport system ATP-binding protein